MVSQLNDPGTVLPQLPMASNKTSLHLDFVQNMWLNSKFKNRSSSRCISHQNTLPNVIHLNLFIKMFAHIHLKYSLMIQNYEVYEQLML